VNFVTSIDTYTSVYVLHNLYYTIVIMRVGVKSFLQTFTSRALQHETYKGEFESGPMWVESWKQRSKRLRETSDKQYLQAMSLDPLQRRLIPLPNVFTERSLAWLQDPTES